MKIAVYNRKGGQGKSTLSLALAKELPAGIITNDDATILEDICDADSFIKLSDGEALPRTGDDIDIIFDLGGFADERVNDAIRQSDAVVVPAILRNQNEWVNAIDSVHSALAINKNVIFVEMKPKDKEFSKQVMDAVANIGASYIAVPYSIALNDILSDGVGISERINSYRSSLPANQLRNRALKPIESIINFARTGG